MKYQTIGEGAEARRVSAICLGAMKLGGEADEETSFAILDRFVERGGTMIDTANNYQFWVDGYGPDDSERTIGHWLASRKPDRERLVIGTKFGARPTVPGGGIESWEGNSAAAVRAAVAGSRSRLGVERLDLYYPHVDDRRVPQEETLEALGAEVAAGTVGLTGASNHAAWRLERARGLSEARGWPRYRVLQLRYSYLRPRLDVPLPEASHQHVTEEHLDFARSENLAGRDTTLVTYTPLLFGSYTRPDRELSPPYHHPGTESRLAALDTVAKETEATRNQVVLAWLMSQDVPIIPLVGVTTVWQVDEALAATELDLTPDQRTTLDNAG
ncbi:aldo/keto reductase [Spiractinospora alimapuensis]|uniref:aldo/keto reductase n=1 Tax=Spiractinospora alimapuensis TaxID=2820884 RepID=UPI001F291217|nr:aldo/keto reductase [Spiractinospora alimapuensis]QVQ51764.1 aldo/keto reductase [Spiractinospora alimapuensis]